MDTDTQGETGLQPDQTAVPPAAGESADTQTATQESPPDAGEPRRSRRDDRIDELTRDKYALANDRDYWRAKALETQQAPPAPPQPDPVEPREPTLDQFSGDVERFVTAHQKWTKDYFNYRETKLIATTEARRVQQQQAEEAQRADRTWTERVKAAESKYADFRAVALNPTLPVTPAMSEVIKQSEHGAEVLRYLGLNPEKAARIAAMPPVAAAAALGRLESDLVRNSRPQLSNAPPPPNTVGGSNEIVGKDPEKMSTAEWMEWRRSQLKRR